MLCLPWALILCCTVVSALTTYYMDEHCGESLSMDMEPTASLSLKLTSAEQYDANMNCYVTFRASPVTQIMTSLVWIDIQSYRHCPGDYLQILTSRNSGNGTATADTVSPICGHRKPDMVILSQTNDITVRFVSDGDFFGKGFHIVLTQFHVGPCEAGEYGCDNGRCVDAGLVCRHHDVDVFNHCGDFSNGCRLPVSVIVCVCLGILVFLIVVSLMSVVGWNRVRRRRDGHPEDEWHVHPDDSLRGRENEAYIVVSADTTSSSTLPSYAQVITSTSTTHLTQGSSEQQSTPSCITAPGLGVNSPRCPVATCS